MNIEKQLIREAEFGFFETFAPITKKTIENLKNEGFRVRIENNVLHILFGCTISWRHSAVLNDQEILSGYIDCLSPDPAPFDHYSFSERLWIKSMKTYPRPKEALSVLTNSF